MKKKLFSFMITGLIAASPGLMNPSNAADDVEGNQSGFIAKQDGKTIKETGDPDARHAPCSTFKVALALMGFDAGILKTKDSPKWAFKEKYEKNFQSWYTRAKGKEYGWIQDHTPATFMSRSVVWFSHKITKRLGKEKFQNYVGKLAYGNQDVSGTSGKDDGLLNSWLETSLKISPREQVDFLQKLLADHLDLSKDAQEKTKEIMDRKEEWNGWKLYGKTGVGSGKTGWFIGWVQKEERKPIIFARYLRSRLESL